MRLLTHWLANLVADRRLGIDVLIDVLTERSALPKLKIIQIQPFKAW